jgi:3-oxoacyl-[acyl-carrier protein] reductase
MGAEQKVAVITGASQGIGAALVKAYLDRNYRVIATARSVKPMSNADVLVVPGDIADRKTAERAISEGLGRFGRIDTLVNNAGITQDARLQKMTLQQFDAVIDVNLRGVFHCAQAVADTMVAQGSGSILNASSVVGIYGNFGQTNYAATKFGVIGFTKTWSRELGPKGIRVNAVAPGFVETPILATVPEKVLQHMREQVPLHRLGKPEEIANVYAFLASDEASYVNGAVIEVSGGMTV